MRYGWILGGLALAMFVGCGSDAGEPVRAVDPGVPVLGSGSHGTDAVELSVIASSADQLDVPRDLAFNPQAPDQLWVLNRTGPSITILMNPGSPAQAADKRLGFGGTHFMAEPAALAFGAPGTFATAQEQDQVTQPSTPVTFMGPTLWMADLTSFNAGHASHLDMLHNSPNSAGIAWERDNVYWVFDGYHSALTRYDFQLDHGPGGEDHSDGVVARFVEGQVAYVPDVPSHLEFDPASSLLYAADTGNARVVVLDTQSGERGGAITPNYDGSEQYEMLNAKLVQFTSADSGLVRPSGIALHDGLVFVGDNATGRISAFAVDGELVDWLDLGLPEGALMGITFDGAGRLYAVDALESRVLRVTPRNTR